MRVKQFLDRIPGGMMVIPLISGAVINTYFPGILEIGGFTTALFRDGASALIGAFLLCMGSGITLKATGKVLKKGAAVTLSKFLFAVFTGLLVNWIFGPEGLWGLSALAVISAMSNTNGGLYAALAGEYGNESDIGAIAVISVNDGPFLTMVAVGTTGLARISWLGLLAVIAPVIIGMVLGNLDRQLKEYLTRGGPVLIPFFAFALGAGLNLRLLAQAGLAGIILGILTTLTGGIVNIWADRKIGGGNGIAGAAASSTAGNAVATPQAVALADPSLSVVATVATPLVAASTITTALLTPLLTWYVAKRNQKEGK